MACLGVLKRDVVKVQDVMVFLWSEHIHLNLS